MDDYFRFLVNIKGFWPRSHSAGWHLLYQSNKQYFMSCNSMIVIVETAKLRNCFQNCRAEHCSNSTTNFAMLHDSNLIWFSLFLLFSSPLFNIFAVVFLSLLFYFTALFAFISRNVFQWSCSMNNNKLAQKIQEERGEVYEETDQLTKNGNSFRIYKMLLLQMIIWLKYIYPYPLYFHLYMCVFVYLCICVFVFVFDKFLVTYSILALYEEIHVNI